MSAQKNNEIKYLKNVVNWILAIVLFFVLGGPQIMAECFNINIPVPRVIIIGLPPIMSQSQPPQKSEAELEEERMNERIEDSLKKQPVVKLTQQQQEEREKIIMKRAKEDNLNPTNALRAYKTAKYFINNRGNKGCSEDMLHYVLTQNNFSDAEAKNAIVWLVNYREIDFFEQAYLAAENYLKTSDGSGLVTNELERLGFTREQCIYARKKLLKVKSL